MEGVRGNTRLLVAVLVLSEYTHFTFIHNSGMADANGICIEVYRLPAQSADLRAAQAIGNSELHSSFQRFAPEQPKKGL